MTRDEFNTQMVRLSSRWKAAYDPEIGKLIWREVQDLPARWFERCVDEWIGSLRQAPLLPDVREQISRERERTRQSQKAMEQFTRWTPPINARCHTCADTGIVRAALIENPCGFYAFKCSCETGRVDQRLFPRWADADDSRYEILYSGGAA